jgi:hypothetical protein
MVRQAYHEWKQLFAVLPEPVEGLNQSFLKATILIDLANAYAQFGFTGF